MKISLHPALRYFLAFFLLYSALVGISLIPRVGFFCNALYQGPTEPILQSLFSKAYLQLKTDEVNPDILRIEFASKAQVEAQMAQAREGSQRSFMVKGLNTEVQFYNLFLTFYLFFVVLLVLSPLGIWGKIGRLLVGTVIYYFYTVFKIWLQLMSTFNEPEIAIYNTGELSLRIIRSTLSGMTLGINILFVLVLWILLVFNKDNWSAFMQKVAKIRS